MSELSRGVLAGTEQVARSYSGLASLRARSKAREREDWQNATATLNASLKEYGSWADAKAAEDEERQVSDAYALGMQTGDPRKALVTLGAVRPKKASAARLRDKYLDATMGAVEDYDKRQGEDVDRVLRERRYERDFKNAEKLTGIREAELEIARGREARLGAAPKPTENIDPLSETGIERASLRARRIAESEAEVKTRYPGAQKEPSELDKPYPPKTRELFEKKAGLEPGSLDGVIRRDVEDLLDLDPERNDVRAIRLAAERRKAADYEPAKLKAARKKLEKAENDLADFLDRAALEPFVDKARVAKRQGELETAVAKARTGVETEERATPVADVKTAPEEMSEDELDEAIKAAESGAR